MGEFVLFCGGLQVTYELPFSLLLLSHVDVEPDGGFHVEGLWHFEAIPGAGPQQQAGADLSPSRRSPPAPPMGRVKAAVPLLLGGER